MIVIADVELLLPEDERIGGPIHCYSEGITGLFPSITEIIVRRTEVERTKVQAMTKAQAEIKPEAWVKRHIVVGIGPPPLAEPLTIYGHIPSFEEISKREKAHGTSPSDLERTLARLRNGLSRNWLYGQWYSEIEPEGEYGCAHRADVEAITQAEFEQARQNNWP